MNTQKHFNNTEIKVTLSYNYAGMYWIHSWYIYLISSITPLVYTYFQNLKIKFFLHDNCVFKWVSKKKIMIYLWNKGKKNHYLKKKFKKKRERLHDFWFRLANFTLRGAHWNMIAHFDGKYTKIKYYKRNT